MGAVKLKSASVTAARFSSEGILDLVIADDDLRVSDSEKGEGICAYLGECSFSSVDIKSFQEEALSRPELQDASPATLCSETGNSDEEEVQELLDN